jgi:DNA-binding transcriptional ArsR family regulator
MRREHLARALGITPQAVSYHARALERLGLVCVRRRGRVAEVMLRAPDRAR